MQQEDLYDYWHSGTSNTMTVVVKLFNNAIPRGCNFGPCHERLREQMLKAESDGNAVLKLEMVLD